MSQVIEEQLSALLDGELPAEQEALLLRRLDSDPDLREKLTRFGMIGELLRDASAPASAMDISRRVSIAIAAEETPSESLGRSGYSSSAGTGYAGAAIAASIALVVMFNLSSIGSTTGQPGINTVVQSVQPSHDHGGAMAVDPARLTRYLVSHSQYTNSASRQLFDSHLAMAVNTGAVTQSYE